MRAWCFLRTARPEERVAEIEQKVPVRKNSVPNRFPSSLAAPLRLDVHLG